MEEISQHHVPHHDATTPGVLATRLKLCKALGITVYRSHRPVHSYILVVHCFWIASHLVCLLALASLHQLFPSCQRLARNFEKTSLIFLHSGGISFLMTIFLELRLLPTILLLELLLLPTMLPLLPTILLLLPKILLLLPTILLSTF
jgi:hypothetical protein